MTLKEKYINERNNKNFTFETLYEYYLSKVQTDPISFTVFINAMQFADINVIVETMDREFGITTLNNKDGGFIKVVE
jgi:hypothetical protein